MMTLNRAAAERCRRSTRRRPRLHRRHRLRPGGPRVGDGGRERCHARDRGGDGAAARRRSHIAVENMPGGGRTNASAFRRRRARSQPAIPRRSSSCFTIRRRQADCSWRRSGFADRRRRLSMRGAESGESAGRGPRAPESPSANGSDGAGIARKIRLRRHRHPREQEIARQRVLLRAIVVVITWWCSRCLVDRRNASVVHGSETRADRSLLSSVPNGIN